VTQRAPQATESEQALIGAVIIDPDTMGKVVGRIEATDFYLPKHQYIYSAILDCFSSGDPLEPAAISLKLQAQEQLTKVGGAGYLLECAQLGSPANVSWHIARIREAAEGRNLQVLGMRIIQAMDECAGDYTAGRELAGEFIETYLQKKPVDREIYTMSELIDHWEAWNANPEGGAIPTPWAELNTALKGGFWRQRLYVIGARPGSGKTTSGLNAVLWAATCGYSAAVFSLEMSKEQVATALLAAGAHADYGQMNERLLSADTRHKVSKFITENRSLKLKACDKSGVTIEWIAQQCRAMKREGLDVVFIDYAQLLGTSKAASKETRERAVAHISQQAKILARELDIVVILAAQLNRNGDEDRMPKMSDLRESGGLENDADVVILLRRDPDVSYDLQVVLAKVRNGQQDSFTLREQFDQARIT
jgi:replicative DNA helicase